MSVLAGGFYVERGAISEAEEAALGKYLCRAFPSLRKGEVSHEERLAELAEPLAEGEDTAYLDRQVARGFPVLR